MCPDWGSNWQPFSSQAGTQSTEPHQPGLGFEFLLCVLKTISLGQIPEEVTGQSVQVVSVALDLFCQIAVYPGVGPVTG